MPVPAEPRQSVTTGRRRVQERRPPARAADRRHLRNRLARQQLEVSQPELPDPLELDLPLADRAFGRLLAALELLLRELTNLVAKLALLQLHFRLVQRLPVAMVERLQLLKVVANPLTNRVRLLRRSRVIRAS